MNKLNTEILRNLLIASAMSLTLGCTSGTSTDHEAESSEKADLAGDASPTSSACTNFSGFWAGVCQDNIGTVDPSYFALEQEGCSEIHTGFYPLMVGGENETEWKMAPGFQARRKDNSYWDGPSQEVLLADVSVEHDQGGFLVSIDGQATLERPAEDELVLAITGTIEIDGSEQPFDQLCEYDLVASIP